VFIPCTEAEVGLLWMFIVRILKCCYCHRVVCWRVHVSDCCCWSV